MDSLGSDALTGMEVTPLHAENRKLLRKVARQEKKLEKYVKKIEGESASKLKELEFLINKQHFVEEKHSNLMQMFKDNQMQFIYDMDARLADESQVHADKQQLEQHKDDKLPHWIGSFDAINTVIKANGHSNRLRWRSKTVAKIIHCVNEIMAGEPPKEQFDDVNRRTGCDEEIRNGVSDDVAYELDRAEVVASLEATIAAVVAATSPVPTNSVAADLEQSLQNQRQQELQGTELDEERIASAEFVAEDDISACLSSCGSNSVSSVAPATGTDGGNNLSNINGDNATPQLDGRGLQVRRILERFVLEINLTNANVMLKQFAQLRKMIRERYFNTEPIYGYSNNDDFNDVTISGLLQDYEEDLEAHSVVTYAGTHDTTPSPSVAMSEQHYDDDWTAVQRQRRDVRRTDQVRHLNLTLADKRRERRENESSKDRRFNTSGVIKSKIRKTASGGTLTSPHKNSRRVNSLDGSEDDDYDRSSNTSPAGTSPGRLRKQTRKFIPISTNSGMNTGATSQSQSLSGSPLTTRKNSAAEAQRQQSGRFSYHRKSSVDADMELMCNPLDMRQNITQSGGDSGTSSIVPSVHDTDNDDDGNENRSNSGDCDAGSGHIGAYGHNDDHSYISAVSVGSNANSYNTLSTLNDKSRAGTLATKEVDFLNGQYTLHGVKHNTTTSADLGDKMKTFTDKVATDTKIAPDTRALIQLRSAAKNGDFRHAWSVFRKSYDPPMKPKPKKEKKRDLTGYSVIGHNSPNLFDDSDMPVDHLSAEEKEALAALQKGGDWEEDLDVERSEEDKAALSRIRQAVKNSRSNSPSTGGSIGGPPGSINTESSEQARFNRHVTTADLTSFPEKSRSTLLDSKLINGKVNGMNNSSSGIKMSNTMSQLDNTLSKLKGESPKPKSKKVLAQMNEWSRWPNIKPKEKKLPTPGKPPISMLVFKLLMIAFKNAPVIDFRNACEVMDTLALYPELSPDVTLFNVMMSACIRDSRWRRCMAIYTDMTTIHHLLPTSQTFEIIIDSCRHSLDSPSTIYEVLRKDYKLPHE